MKSINPIESVIQTTDIIKAHGREIKVQTKEDEGSEFVIQLPLKPMANEDHQSN